MIVKLVERRHVEDMAVAGADVTAKPPSASAIVGVWACA